MMIINYGNTSIAVQEMRAYMAAETGSYAKAMSDVPQSELEQSTEGRKRMTLKKETAAIVKKLHLNFAKVKEVGSKNKGGWSVKQEKQIVHDVNRFASDAKKQYMEGDFKNAYLNMRIYANAKNKLLGNPVDEFDLEDVLYDIDKQMRTTVKPAKEIK